MKLDRLLGLFGSAAVAFGLSLPSVEIPILGTATSFDVAPLVTEILLLVAIGAAYFALRGNSRNVISCGFLAIVLIASVFYKTLIHMGLAENQVAAKFTSLAVQGGMTPGDLPIHSLMSETRLGSSFWVMLFGAAVLLVAGIWMRRSHKSKLGEVAA